jgi:thiol-disulfide isomerase/thioredoxin
VQKIGALLLLVLLIVLFIFLGREDETSKDISLPVENTTDIIPEEVIEKPQEIRFKLEKTEKNITAVSPVLELPDAKKVTFILTGTKEVNHTVTLSNQEVLFTTSEKPILLVNIFTTWCLPCIGEIPYLNDLQKKYHKELFVAGILTHETIETSALNTFISKQQINYFVSNSTNNDAFSALLANTLDLPENFSIPLTAMYVNGEYFTHYEGTVPVEMIEYDIQQAKKQLNAR